MKLNIRLEREKNDFFREMIIDEWHHHNTVDPIYQLEIINPSELTFEINEVYYKILNEEVVVGFIGIKDYPEEIYLYRFYIKEEYRSQGIGTIALNLLIEDAKKQNKDISLEVMGDNKAYDLYKRLGFVTHYRRMVLKVRDNNLINPLIESNTFNIHRSLNAIYDLAENFYEYAKNNFNEVSLNSYKGHLIKLNGKFLYQKYFMPVVSIGDYGDVCFNLDSISFEFFVEKNKFINKCNIEKLLNYDSEIYDGECSEEDIYIKGMSVDELINKLQQIKTVGISIYANNKNFNELCSYFKEINDIINNA